MKRFFWMCSGADQDLLAECSKSEQIKQAGIGGTVFFTAIMATIAASYALYTVFDNIFAAIFFGLVWGLLIFNLDRFIVSTIKKRDSVWKELIQATPRIALAVIIAIVIAKPLELKIFEKEIDQILLEEKNQLTLDNQSQIALQYNPTIEALKADNDQLKREIAEKETEVNDLYNTYITEAEGTSGTMKLGKGPVYKEKREKHDAELQSLQNLKDANNQKIAANDAAIAAVTNDYATKVKTTQPIIDGFDGLMARIGALDKLPWLPSFFIFLLFLAIETSPIIAKLLAPKGEYDLRLEDHENSIKTWVAQKIDQREQILGTDTGLNNKVYEDIAEEDELYDYKKKKARELMKLQADAFYENQKRIL